MALYQININAQQNQPPSQVGDGLSELDYGDTLVFTKALLTTNLVPPYQDPEGDEPQSIRILAIPTDGELQLNGVAVINNQVISFSDIEAGLFTYVPDINIKISQGLNFQFEISDEGSGQFVG